MAYWTKKTALFIKKGGVHHIGFVRALLGSGGSEVYMGKGR